MLFPKCSLGFVILFCAWSVVAVIRITNRPSADLILVFRIIVLLKTAPSEVQTDLRFELAAVVVLGLDTTEGVSSTVDAQIRTRRRGMVENIRRVHPELDSLGFGYAHELAHRRVKGPGAGQLHRLAAEIASMSWLRIFQENLTCCGVLNCLQGAIRLQVDGDEVTLRICDLGKLGWIEVISGVAIPLNAAKGL